MKVIITKYKEFEEEVEVNFPIFYKEKIDVKTSKFTRRGWEYTKLISPTEEVTLAVSVQSGPWRGTRVEMEHITYDVPGNRESKYFPETPITQKEWDKVYQKWMK